MADANQRRRAILNAVLPPLAVILALIGGIELLGAVDLLSPSFAPPSRIAAEMGHEPGLLWFHVEPTLLTASTGFVLSLLLSLVIAFACFAWPRLEAVALTMGAVMDSVPIIAIAPVLAIWLGLSLPMRISLTVMICTFPILVSLFQGLRAVPATADEMFTVLAASPWRRFRLLAAPYALPYIFVGLKVAAPLAVLGALMAETTGVERGLGAFIVDAMFGVRIAQLWAGVVLACLMSVSGYALVALFERLAVGADWKVAG